MKSGHRTSYLVLAALLSTLNLSCVSNGDEGSKVSPGEYDTVFQDNLLKRRTAKLILQSDGSGKYSETLDGVCVIEQSNFDWTYSGGSLRFSNLMERTVPNCDQNIFQKEYASKEDEAAKIKNPNKCHFEMEILDSSKRNISAWFIWEAAASCKI